MRRGSPLRCAFSFQFFIFIFFLLLTTSPISEPRGGHTASPRLAPHHHSPSHEMRDGKVCCVTTTPLTPTSPPPLPLRARKHVFSCSKSCHAFHSLQN